MYVRACRGHWQGLIPALGLAHSLELAAVFTCAGDSASDEALPLPPACDSCIQPRPEQQVTPPPPHQVPELAETAKIAHFVAQFAVDLKHLLTASNQVPHLSATEGPMIIYRSSSTNSRNKSFKSDVHRSALRTAAANSTPQVVASCHG